MAGATHLWQQLPVYSPWVDAARGNWGQEQFRPPTGGNPCLQDESWPGGEWVAALHHPRG